MSAINTALITRAEVLDLIDAAGYGIGYWATEGQVDPDEQTYTVSVSNEFPAEHRNGPYTVTFQQLTEAWAALAAERRLTRDGCEFLDGCDSNDADLIVQRACFGTVVFG